MFGDFFLMGLNIEELIYVYSDWWGWFYRQCSSLGAE